MMFTSNLVPDYFIKKYGNKYFATDHSSFVFFCCFSFILTKTEPHFQKRGSAKYAMKILVGTCIKFCLTGSWTLITLLLKNMFSS